MWTFPSLAGINYTGISGMFVFRLELSWYYLFLCNTSMMENCSLTSLPPNGLATIPGLSILYVEQCDLWLRSTRISQRGQLQWDNIHWRNFLWGQHGSFCHVGVLIELHYYMSTIVDCITSDLSYNALASLPARLFSNTTLVTFLSVQSNIFCRYCKLTHSPLCSHLGKNFLTTLPVSIFNGLNDLNKL